MNNKTRCLFASDFHACLLPLVIIMLLLVILKDYIHDALPAHSRMG